MKSIEINWNLSFFWFHTIQNPKPKKIHTIQYPKFVYGGEGGARLH